MVKYAHDIMDRVTNISWRTTGGATLGGFAYEYDAVGRITSRSHALGDPSQPSPMSQSSQKTYAYDDFDRLSSDGDVAYTYDAAGNRMTRTEDGDTITYTLGVGDRLASYGRADSMNPPQSGSYAYDAAGNVTRIERDGSPTLDLAWNSQCQLVSVATNGVFAESYTYDALSRRVSTTTLEGTIHHVYDDNWQVIADIDANGSVVASYVWGEDIDNLLAVNISGATYYPLTDVQGTVWGYVDAQNNVVANWQYDAWGNVLSEDISPSIVALATLRYRFQGREWSAATGLTNFRMRWYDAETGRWLSKDPIGYT
jgi:RHS repeat-associated protein